MTFFIAGCAVTAPLGSSETVGTDSPSGEGIPSEEEANTEENASDSDALPLDDDSLQVDASFQRPIRTNSVTGYYAWWMKGAWLDLDLSMYDRILFFSVDIRADGRIENRNGWPHAWVSFLKQADSLRIPVTPTITMMDPDSIRTLFQSPSAIATLLQTSHQLIAESQGQGLHIDIEYFESAPDSIREGFVGFTDSLAQSTATRWPDAHLSIFAPAFEYDGLFDLSRMPDGYQEIMVQGYDMHWLTGPTAGPVAPLTGWDQGNWIQIVDRYEQAGIDPERLVMTVPYFGYEWPVDSLKPGASTLGEGNIVTFAPVDTLILPDIQTAALRRIARFGEQRDNSSGSPFYVMTDSSGMRQGWYEDETSLADKYRYILERGLGGIAVFPIGYDAGMLDPLINQEFGFRKGNQ